ncbi:hypothetical protein GCM10027445_34480 [Amycolatopsis endophytica]|uniref:Uncharacterized protein n=1 Tax=Amycolatopsis endophytica TaxID=860233 RepID=A0A853B154_9PSEU|nr:hypothetical protein [Amycolatopsis endophytica]NYI88511.1 hypothetical protein [Amycolatopsis endophytica]
MRKTGLMKTTRRALTVTAMTAAVVGGSLLTTGTASASTVLSQACSGTVVGALSDQVAVQGKDVAGIVKAGAQEQEWFLHLNGVDPAKIADTITKKGAVTVGEIPAGTASGAIDGNAIATAVTTALKDAGDPYQVGLGIGGDQQQKTLDAIQRKVAGNCGLATFANNYQQPGLPSTQPGPTTTVPGTTAPSTTPGISGTGSATAPPRNYGNIPAAVPGVAGVAVPPSALYPSTATLPDQALPQVGVLGGSSGTTGGQADVRTAGNASAIGGEPAGGNVQLPMLLAVVALAGVSAALVRTWVLRKLS